MKSKLIAPCGMNCALCVAYQRKKKKCNGCGSDTGLIPTYRQKCVIGNCAAIEDTPSGLCCECADFPCKPLQRLDEHYNAMYGLSMIENLHEIKTQGMDAFLAAEEDRWKCRECGHVLCANLSICEHCKTPR